MCWRFSPKKEEIYRVLVKRLCNGTIPDQKMVCTRGRTIYVRDVFLNKPPKKRKFSRPGKLFKLTCIQTARSAVDILPEDIHSIPSVPLKTGK